VNALTGNAYFRLFARLLKTNPPNPGDAPMVARLAKLGIVPGKEFNPALMDAATVNAIAAAPKAGQQEIASAFASAVTMENGWGFPKVAGTYGIAYSDRAAVTWYGLGANRKQDALYPTSELGPDNQTYNGNATYTMHFNPGSLPPVNGFWSITMYDEKYFFVPNALQRQNLSSRNAFKKNADGSIDLVFSHASPGAAKESNWLPAPAGRFVLMMRNYWPKDAIINGSWKPPVVQKQ
jgi:hypothetical protein